MDRSSLIAPLTENRTRFEQTFAKMKPLSDEDLFVPDRFAWLVDDPAHNPFWKRIVAGPGCCHYHDHFYDLLIRIDVDQRFIPELARLPAFAGTYIDGKQRALTFHVRENCLIIQTWRGQELPGLALDAVRFAYNEFGLVTFQSASNGTVPTLEWWNQVFQRVGS